MFPISEASISEISNRKALRLNPKMLAQPRSHVLRHDQIMSWSGFCHVRMKAPTGSREQRCRPEVEVLGQPSKVNESTNVDHGLTAGRPDVRAPWAPDHWD